jgi:hypothetical protein
MKKILLSVLTGVFVVVIVLAAAKNTIARVSIEKGVEVVTGLPLKMKSLNIGIINTLVGINDLRLFNPPGYEDKVMLDMPEIFIDYDLLAIIGGKIHLEEVRINLKELVVVKNAQGELNLNSLKTVQQQKETKEPEPAKKGKAPELQIDTLELKIGKVIYKDYSKGGEPSVKEFNINIDEKFYNIDNPNKLVSLILVRALMNTTVGRLANFDVNSLKGSIGDTLATGQKIIGEAGETASKVTQQAQEATKSTTETFKKMTEGLGGLFGSDKK